jgi:hypothetical protein
MMALTLEILVLFGCWLYARTTKKTLILWARINFGFVKVFSLTAVVTLTIVVFACGVLASIVD